MADEMDYGEDCYWNGPDQPVSPHDMADLLAKHACDAVAALHYPEVLGGASEVPGELLNLAGMLIAMADQYTWPAFQELNQDYFQTTARLVKAREAALEGT
jgi:hypothetical protein